MKKPNFISRLYTKGRLVAGLTVTNLLLLLGLGGGCGSTPVESPLPEKRLEIPQVAEKNDYKKKVKTMLKLQLKEKGIANDEIENLLGGVDGYYAIGDFNKSLTKCIALAKKSKDNKLSASLSDILKNHENEFIKDLKDQAKKAKKIGFDDAYDIYKEIKVSSKYVRDLVLAKAVLELQNEKYTEAMKYSNLENALSYNIDTEAYDIISFKNKDLEKDKKDVAEQNNLIDAEKERNEQQYKQACEAYDTKRKTERENLEKKLKEEADLKYNKDLAENNKQVTDLEALLIQSDGRAKKYFEGKEKTYKGQITEYRQEIEEKVKEDPSKKEEYAAKFEKFKKETENLIQKEKDKYDEIVKSNNERLAQKKAEIKKANDKLTDNYINEKLKEFDAETERYKDEDLKAEYKLDEENGKLQEVKTIDVCSESLGEMILENFLKHDKDIESNNYFLFGKDGILKTYKGKFAGNETLGKYIAAYDKLEEMYKSEGMDLLKEGTDGEEKRYSDLTLHGLLTKELSDDVNFKKIVDVLQMVPQIVEEFITKYNTDLINDIKFKGKKQLDPKDKDLKCEFMIATSRYIIKKYVKGTDSEEKAKYNFDDSAVRKNALEFLAGGSYKGSFDASGSYDPDSKEAMGGR